MQQQQQNFGHGLCILKFYQVRFTPGTEVIKLIIVILIALQLLASKNL